MFPLFSRTITTLVVLSATLALHAQTSSNAVKDDLFNGTEKFAKGASDVEEITMDPDTLARVGGSRDARGMVLNVVRTYSYPKPGMYSLPDVEEFRNKLNTGDWHCSVHISHPLKGESTDVCERRRADNMRETAIITVEPRELTFIHKIMRGGASGPQSWSVTPGLYGGAYSGAEMQADIAVQMAEMRANMAGMDAELAGQGLGLPMLPDPFTGPEMNKLRKLSEQLGHMSAAAPAESASPKKPAPTGTN